MTASKEALRFISTSSVDMECPEERFPASLIAKKLPWTLARKELHATTRMKVVVALLHMMPEEESHSE
jgi:hypothetical protein